MRLRLALLLLLAPLALAACGGDGGGEPAGQPGATGGASIAPSGTELFISANTDFESDQWQKLEALAERIPALKEGLADPDFQKARDALGPEVAVLALRFADTASDAFIGLTQAQDEAQLRQLLEQDNNPTVVEEIDGWQAFADSRDTLDRFKSARNSGTLAEDPLFTDAVDGLPAERLAVLYLSGEAVSEAITPDDAEQGQPQQVPGVGRAAWLSGALEVRDEGFALQLRAKGDEVEATTFAAELPAQVPAGVLALLSFEGLDRTLDELLKNPSVQKRLGGADAFLGDTLAKVVALFANEGVLYVRPGTPQPEFTIALEVTDEQEAAATLDELVAKVGTVLKSPPEDVEVSGVPAKKLTTDTGALFYTTFDGKLVVTSAESGIAGLRDTGTKLPDDPIYSAAIEAAGLPDETAGSLYINTEAIVQLVGGLLGEDSAPRDLPAATSGLGSIVGWAAVEDAELAVHAFVGVK
jgi:hypothetical protein